MTIQQLNTEFAVRKREPQEVLAALLKHPDLPHRMVLLNEVDLVPEALDLLHLGATDSQPIKPEHETELRLDAQIVERFRNSSEGVHDYGLILGLYLAATGLQEIFPDAFHAGVRRGAQSLVMSSLYALNAHRENGHRSRVELPLHGSKERTLKLDLEGDEPFRIIRRLFQAMHQLCEVVGSPETGVTKINTAPDFTIYRFWDKGGDLVANPATVYVRPYGSVTYKADAEYGRPGEGVEASISYVIDTGALAGQPLPIGKWRQSAKPDERISIRIDREGVRPVQRGQSGIVRDPTQESGTLSLDVGSVLGEDSWIGTKVGRFLAWGDLLRSEALGRTPQLNHATQFFDELHGHRDVFADNAQEMLRTLTSRKLAAHTINQLFKS